MRSAATLLLVLIILSCQREREITPKAVQLIEGQWEATFWNPPANGEKVWKEVGVNQRGLSLVFRSDGYPVDADGLGMCCPPANLLINGKLFAIDPKLPVSTGHKCAGVWCRSCETIEIQATDTNLLWTNCDGVSIRYRRLP